MRKLTAKQQRFVAEYLLDCNATQAAIRSGYSPRNADKIGSQLLGKSRVKLAVAHAQQERAKRSDVEADQVLKSRAAIAFFDLRTVVSWGPEGLAVKGCDELSAGVAEIVEKVTTRRRTLRIRCHDKVRALVALAKHLNLISYLRPAD